MPIAKTIKYMHEPTKLQCGQAVLCMLSGESIERIISLCKTERETTLSDMFSTLDMLKIKYCREKKAVHNNSELPNCCILSLETPHCWHWSLYKDGVFYDPEYGVLDDFPPSFRRYFFEIIE